MGQLAQMVRNQSITESLTWDSWGCWPRWRGINKFTESLTWDSWGSWPRWWGINQSLSLLPEIHGEAGPDGEESINHRVSYLRFMGQLAQMVRNQSITASLTVDSWGSWPRWWGINQSLHLLPEIHGAAGPDGEALWVADPTCRTDPDKPNRYRWSSLREKCRLPILWHTPLKKKSCC